MSMEGPPHEPTPEERIETYVSYIKNQPHMRAADKKLLLSLVDQKVIGKLTITIDEKNTLEVLLGPLLIPVDRVDMIATALSDAYDMCYPAEVESGKPTFSFTSLH